MDYVEHVEVTMTILVTGAGGFLGGHLVDLLVERGESVRILARPDEDVTRLAQSGVDVCRGDLTDYPSLEAAMSGVKCALNCAARTGPWGPEHEYKQVNVHGVKMLVEAAMAAGVRRIVHVSSITVHGVDIHGSADEEAPLRGGSDPYSRTKAAGELVLQQLIKNRKAPVTIVRPGLIYGPRDTNSFGRFARLIEHGKMPIIGTGNNRLPLIYVTDVAEGILLASRVEQSTGRAYLLVNDEPVTQQDYFTAIARELGVAPPKMHIPYQLALALAATAEATAHLARRQQAPPLMRFGLMQVGGENRFVIRRAREELGFSPQMNLTDGIRQAIAWYRTK
jgi:nucleoside-diphosphate-sugar epimerase